MPYEDVLPYPDFAVRLRQHALYRLPEVLETIVRTKGMVSFISATAASPITIHLLFASLPRRDNDLSYNDTHARFIACPASSCREVM